MWTIPEVYAAPQPKGNTMTKKSRWLKMAASLLLLAVLLVAGFLLRVVFPIINGHTAKVFASSLYVAGREEGQIVAEDVAQYIRFLRWSRDEEARSVTVSCLGLASRTAVYHPGIGVTLLAPGKSEVAFETEFTPVEIPGPEPHMLWPQGDGPIVEGLSALPQQALEEAIAWAFEEPGEIPGRRTRAVLVVQGDRLIAERYAPGFDAHTPLLGWSMSKSVTSALVGVLVKEGKLDLHAPAPVAEWQEAGDARQAITLDRLLRMSSGLEFNEDYGDPFADVLHMLYRSEDFGSYAARCDLAHGPDTHWAYSSGTSNLVSRIVREAVGGTQADYFNFPRTALFGPLGMGSALMEPDASGTFVGSSYTYATARDWARFGLLYLRDGVWEGERILPEGWVKYSTTPTPTAPKGNYGAHWWLNAGPSDEPERRPMPSLPGDLYFASGHEGQFVVVVPSRDVVIVRLGLTTEGKFPLEAFIRRILDAVP